MENLESEITQEIKKDNNPSKWNNIKNYVSSISILNDQAA
jgi:hypothetical protein